MKEELRCAFCGGGEFERQRVEYVYRRQGKYLIVRDVPCEVCLHCGERYYAGDVLLTIEKRFEAIHEHRQSPQSVIRVPLERYTWEHAWAAGA